MKDWLSRLFFLFAGSEEQQLRRFIERRPRGYEANPRVFDNCFLRQDLRERVSLVGLLQVLATISER